MNSISVIQSMLQYGMCFIGTAYRWGGDDPIDGFDCSGFVQELLSSVGMDPSGDQTAQGLYDMFRYRSLVDKKGPGAIAFYGKSIHEIKHVAMMLNECQILEAGGGGSKTIDRASAASANAFVRVRPVNRRPDLVAVLMPQYPSN